MVDWQSESDLDSIRNSCDVLTVPPDFQYQNEKQVAANQDYIFKKFSL